MAVPQYLGVGLVQVNIGVMMEDLNKLPKLE